MIGVEEVEVGLQLTVIESLGEYAVSVDKILHVPKQEIVNFIERRDALGADEMVDGRDCPVYRISKGDNQLYVGIQVVDALCGSGPMLLRPVGGRP